MFKRSELAIPIFICAALSIFALLTRYFIRPLPILLVCEGLLALAYTRVGRPIQLSRMLSFILVFVLVAFMNFLVFVVRMHPEQALVYFLIILQIARAYTLNKFKDYVQIMLLSSLGIMAAGSFNPNPSFPVVLVVFFCIGGYWIYKFHLITEYIIHARKKENSPVVIIHNGQSGWIRPFVRMSLVTCSLALIVFSVIPRQSPSFSLASEYLSSRLSSTGFSNELMLGEMSKILEDKTPVLRAKYLPEEDQRKNYSGVLYLRGAVYNRYVQQGNTWKWIQERGIHNIRQIGHASGTKEPGVIQGPIWHKSSRNLWRFTFEQPIAVTNLFVVDRPLAISTNQVMNLSYNFQSNVVASSSQGIPKGLSYQLFTEQNFTDMKTLPVTTQPFQKKARIHKDEPLRRMNMVFWATTQTATTKESKPAKGENEIDTESEDKFGAIVATETDEETEEADDSADSEITEGEETAIQKEPFLDLSRMPGEATSRPAEMDLSVYRPFAEKMIAKLPATARDMDKIEAIESWLKSNCQYTLDNRDVDRSKEPVLDFLSRRKHGHCEYFSSALVLLAQSLGYKARVVAGFKDGEFNSFGDYYLVRNCDAHAWSEVLFPGIGWVRYDPTPPARDDILRSQDNSSFKWFWDIVDMMQYSWTDRLSAPEGIDRKEFMESLQKQVMGPEEQSKEETWSLRSLWKWILGLFKGRSYKSVAIQVVHFVLILILLGIALFLLRIFVDVMMILWDTLKQNLRRRWEKRYGLIWYCPVEFYRKLLLWLASRGVVRGRQETAEEFVGRMGKIRPDIEKNFSFLTKVYLAIRFGGKRVNLKQKDYLAHLIDLIQQAILTTRVVTREILVNKPIHEPSQESQDVSEPAERNEQE
jgi:hypothetical protein